jgi:hypothetical protein
LLKFGIIAEGPTDQIVIENILVGYFGEDEEPFIHYVQPTRPLGEKPGGWGNVFESLKRRDYETLQFDDYLVIHIDTDVQEEPGYDVPRREGGKELSLPERVGRVIARLIKDIDAAFYQANAHRILFAIAVDSIECWLLPLLHDDKKNAAKITGCFKAANRALGKANKKTLASTGKDGLLAYDNASSGYQKRKTLIGLHTKNPSLELFVKQLNDLQSRLTVTPPAASQTPEAANSNSENPPESKAKDRSR